MLTVRIKNESDVPRLWNIEPYGDDVTLQEGELLTIEVDGSPDVLIEVSLNGAGVGEVLWMSVDGIPVVPSSLRLNDRSLWPR